MKQIKTNFDQQISSFRFITKTQVNLCKTQSQLPVKKIISYYSIKTFGDFRWCAITFPKIQYHMKHETNLCTSFYYPISMKPNHKSISVPVKKIVENRGIYFLIP